MSWQYSNLADYLIFVIGHQLILLYIGYNDYACTPFFMHLSVKELIALILVLETTIFKQQVMGQGSFFISVEQRTCAELP